MLPVCILSIGRSGTSLAARAVNVLGVDLGPEGTMLESTDNNPRGFWEQASVVSLNDEILAEMGGSYHAPPARPPGWEAAPEMARFRSRIETLVSDTFAGRWGFKDPRTAMTLPLWRAAVGEFDYVICARNPIEVAGSLEPVVPPGTRSVDLWLTYMCEILRQTAGRRRIFVFWDDWFAAPRDVASRLATFLDVPFDATVAERIEGFFDRHLRRHEVSDRELAERADVPVAARVLHFLLRDLAAAEERGDADGPALQAVAAALDEWIDERRERERLTAERDTLRAALAIVESSRSWRLTAPLRSARERLRGRD